MARPNNAMHFCSSDKPQVEIRLHQPQDFVRKNKTLNYFTLYCSVSANPPITNLKWLKDVSTCESMISSFDLLLNFSFNVSPFCE